jgi:predicted transcriptional regulator
MSLSGKKERVVLCCLTTEVMKVVEPVRFYEATRTHIIAYRSKGEDDRMGRFFGSFLKEACSRIEWMGRTELMVDYTDTTNQQDVLRTILQIITEERNRCGDFVDIYVNVSSGTPEFVASAIMVSMQQPDIVAFSVGTTNWNDNIEKALEPLSVDGKPTGRAIEVSDPVMVMTFGSETPDDKLVDCLAIFGEPDSRSNNQSFRMIIDRLKEEGIWDYTPEIKKTRTDEFQKERMYLKRNYIEPLVRRGWLVEDQKKRNKYLPTEMGEAVIKVYYKGLASIE